MSITLSLFAGAGAQFFDNNGNPLTGGKIYTYAAGTTTPAVTYTTASDAAFHTNPIVLDAAGRVPSGGEIWLSAGQGYKFVLTTSTDVTIATYDNIPSSTQPPAANDADSIMYESGYVVTAGSFRIGDIYRILTVGTTDYTLIGAVANTVGLHFIATGAGAGTGTAEFSRTVETKLREYASVTDFGAVGDGVVDDTASIQAAIASGARTIFWPAGTYRFTQFGTGIFQKHEATGAVTLITSVASGNAITVSNEYGIQPDLQVNGFYRQEIFNGPFQIYNDNPTSGATGIFFGDTPPATTYSAPNLHINGVVVNRFLVSHAFGNNAYIIQFDNCTFYSRSVGLANSRGIVVNQVLSNSGGLINYDNCIFQGFQDAIFINLGGLELIFNKCSFDVCTNCLANVANDSVLRFTDCRWEWDGDTAQFNVVGNSVGCSVFIDQPYVQFNGTGTAPANPAFAAIGGAGFMSVRSGVWRDAGTGPDAWCSVNGAGTLIYDPTYKTLGAGATVFANKVGAGVASGTLREYLDTKAFSIPISNNTLSIRWGNFTVASPNIAANAITDVDVTWTDPLTTVVAAFAQVYPSTSTTLNDFSGVVTSIPLNTTSHRFGIKNGPVAQGITGQFFILGYE